MKYRVFVGTSSFAEEDERPVRVLESAGAQVIINPYARRMSEEEIIAALDGVDGLLAGLEPLNRRVLSSAPRLKAVARIGIGLTNVDEEAAAELGIKVSNTPEAPPRAVAEMTCAALLALCRRILPSNAALHAGRWKKVVGLGLDGTRVLLVGYGRVGRRMADLLRAFGAEIMIVDPAVDPATLTRGEHLLALDEGLRQAEVVSLHASGENVLLGAEQLGAMRDGAILLNSARGELVDEQALVAALEGGRLGGAWFDAFWQEPYNGPLCRFEQVLLTPHMATYTRQCRAAMETEAARNLVRDLQAA